MVVKKKPTVKRKTTTKRKQGAKFYSMPYGDVVCRSIN
jgi:hypothetical protein